MITSAAILALASCGKEPEQSLETVPAVTYEVTGEADVTVAESQETEVSETTQAFDPADLPAWEGRWQAADTDEHFEISEVNNDGFRLVFYHFEEGQIEEFIYMMEFDNPEKTVASEIGSADGGRWEYTFNFQGDSILVKSKHPDQIYIRAAE